MDVLYNVLIRTRVDQLQVKVRYDTLHLSMEINENGPVYETGPEVNFLGNDLAINNDRIRQLNGSLVVNSNAKGGIQLKLFLPIQPG